MVMTIEIQKRKGGWALMATAFGVIQERLFHYKEDAKRAMVDFSHSSEAQVSGKFDHYFHPIHNT